MAKKQTPEAGQSIGIELSKPRIQHLKVTVIGDSSLIVHRWSEKARKEILDKQMKVPKQGRAAKNPQQEYLDSLYTFNDAQGKQHYGFPAIAFKSAAVTACSSLTGISKVLARQAFHVNGELVAIDGTPQMREDMVRVGMGVADIHFRGEFPEWSSTFDITYNSDVLSASQVCAMLDMGGFAVGVGEWRPEKDGDHGRFHVATQADEVASA